MQIQAIHYRISGLRFHDLFFWLRNWWSPGGQGRDRWDRRHWPPHSACLTSLFEEDMCWACNHDHIDCEACLAWEEELIYSDVDCEAHNIWSENVVGFDVKDKPTWDGLSSVLLCTWSDTHRPKTNNMCKRLMFSTFWFTSHHLINHAILTGSELRMKWILLAVSMGCA